MRCWCHPNWKTTGVWGPKPSFFPAAFGMFMYPFSLPTHASGGSPVGVSMPGFSVTAAATSQGWVLKHIPLPLWIRGVRWVPCTYPVTSATVACTNVKTCRQHQNKKSKNGGSTENCWPKATSYPPSTEGCSVTCHDGLCHVHLSLCLNLKHIIYILFLYINVYIYIHMNV